MYDLIIKDHFVSLIVLIDAGKNLFYKKSFGFANLELKRKADTEDGYRIASTTKPFVATLVIKLAIENKISLNDPLSRYLDRQTLDGIANANNVTVRQLLGMQSGIYNYTDNSAFLHYVKTNPAHIWSANDALSFARARPASFEPGSACDYSNTNYILLGLLIEKVAERSLNDALERYILSPLNLFHTTFEDQSASNHYITPGYVYKKEKHVNISQINNGRGLADGGMISNAQDLNKFIRALITDDFFMPAKWRHQMLDFHSMRSWDGLHYGLGLIRFSVANQVLIGHDGADTGYQSWMFFIPKTTTSIIILSNNNPPALNQVKLIQAIKSLMDSLNR